MPQTSVLPQWRADYPILAPKQKSPSISKRQVRTATAATWAAGVATVTAPSGGYADYTGFVYPMTLSGFTPAGYNGVVQGTIASAGTITFPLAADPGGPGTVFGTITYDAQVPVTVSTTLPATAVPNKPQWSGTALMRGAKSEAPKMPLRNNGKK